MSETRMTVAGPPPLTLERVSAAKPAELLALATSDVVRDIQVARRIFEEAQKVAIVLAPTLNVGRLPAKSALKVASVFIDTTVVMDGKFATYPGREIYRDPSFCQGDDVALTKSALLKIMSAAGIIVLEIGVRPASRDAYHWQGYCTMQRRSLDGIWERSSATRTVDLRDGAPETMKPEKDSQHRKTGKLVNLDPSALANARKHGPANAETKALLRALRAFPGLGIRQSYPLSALKTKPFVVAVLVPDWDPNDAEDMQFARALASGSATHLYGTRQPDSALPPPNAGDAVRALPEATDAPESEPDEPAAPESAIDDSDTDFTEPDVAADEGQVQRYVCACVCGHQVEISKEDHDKTLEKAGTALCAACVPSRKFDVRAHAHLKRLNLPKTPPALRLNETAEAVKFALAKGAVDNR